MTQDRKVSLISRLSVKPYLYARSMKLWQPSQNHIDDALITAFAKQVGFADNDYQALHTWSIEHADQFWPSVWEFCGVVGDAGNKSYSALGNMLDDQWFPEASINYAENLLNAKGSTPSVAFYGEDKVKRTVTLTELKEQVSQCQQALRKLGVNPGDRVAAMLPNGLEALIAMLATVSLGAIWSSASPDFGADGVVDRFGQIEPTVFFCVDGYFYSGKWIDCRAKNAQIKVKLSSLKRSVEVSYHDDPDSEWRRFLDPSLPKEMEFHRVRFDHPLFILFSSGTTGKPKCIVHGHGGTLLQHVKEQQLHSDIKPNDTLFYFTTCGWMMWNWLVSGLASGANLVLYDGNPFAGKPDLLFDIAEGENVTHFGTSAKYLEACNKTKLQPKNTHNLTTLRTLFSTGSPLAPDSFRYVYREIKSDLHLASISGGTDIVSCFALGNPTQAVWLGELQCLGLGMAVNAFDQDGKPTTEKGDLVCMQSFPSMPVGFWNDDDHTKYHAAYFDTYPGVWCHGDFVELTAHHQQAHTGMIIHGRSDAVLNPGGVRIGTAEIYRQVEKIAAVLESVVIGQQWQNDVRVVLFVKLSANTTLTAELTDEIKKKVRANATPRHVPSIIVQVKDIPRTKSGKIVELAVRDTVHGRPIKNKTSLANPEALALFANLEELNK